MNKYIISSYIQSNLNAGPKAKKDIEKIVDKNFGFKLLYINMFN